MANGRFRSGVEADYSPTPSLREVAGASLRRLQPIDVFAAINVALFALMCAFTYYSRFVHYRGAANVWEFFVYAVAIIIGIGLLWWWFRRFAFGVGLLLLVQAGILVHFAGGFVQFDTYRLYDCYVAGIRYDKWVHFFNASVAALVLRHLFLRRRMRLDGFHRFVILLAVLGLGAVVEIVEYLVWKTVPGNGVGGYDNNMQDLIANLAGTTVAVLAFRSTAGARGSALALAGQPPSRAVPARDAVVGAVELALLAGGVAGFAWFGPILMRDAWFVPVMRVVLVALVVYLLYVSPVHIHRDTLAERGLGQWRTAFIRTDNLRPAVRAFAWLALAGSAFVLVLAGIWNPGWFARANWKAWGVRSVFYVGSASIQALIMVGFCIPRLARLTRGPGGELDGRRRLLVAVLAGALFGGLHAPGAALMGLTAAFAFAVALVSLRTPNVFAAAMCQAILGLLLHRVLELSLRVGAFYYQPDLHPMRAVTPFAQRIIGTLY